MARVALRKSIAILAGTAALGLAMPVHAQMYSEGYEFLKAVKDKDGTKVTEMLSTPGATVVNARELNSGRSAMHIVTERRDGVWIDFLAQKGAHVDVRDEQGITPLMLATQINFIDGVERLLKRGANVDVTNNAGETPLMFAVHSRNTELMRVLLEAGANPDRFDNSGRSARDYARLRGANDITLDTITRYEKSPDERETATIYGPR